MNEPKKFLCKKRKNKIFSIEKLRNKDEKNKNPKYSLIEISKLVLNYIKQEKHKTGNEITEYVLNYLKPGNDEKIQKNIQRRVYDSINVMNAAGLIQKNKQQIKYIPRKNKNNDEKMKITKANIIEINKEKNIKEINDKNQEYLDKLKQLNLLQQILIKKYITLKMYENKSNLNNDNNEEKKIIQNKFNITKNKIKYDSKNIKDNEKFKNSDDKSYNTNIDKDIKNFNIIRIYDDEEEDNNYLNKIRSEDANIGNIKEMNNNEDIVFNYIKNLKLFKKELLSFAVDKLNN